ncbi:MAG: signal peptidase I, partial [Clostridia bacterium]|nr:signal peptidase I [Clostridia bacterium]
RHGIEDENITTEYYKSLEKDNKFTKAMSIMDTVFSVVMCVVILGLFAFSSCVNIKKTSTTKNFTLQVVQSGSMSQKYEKNDYLFENNLNDQIQTFDIIITHALPKEDELKVFDIVVYEVDGYLLIHRIIGIEEPNAEHPNERYFLLKGDNNEIADRFPVRYEQMRGIYKGQRIPFLGSFVSFMQSPAGYLCVLLVIFGTIAAPLIEKKLQKEKELRLILIGVIKKAEEQA